MQMNASLSKSTLKFLVYRASVASLAAPLRTPEPTPRPEFVSSEVSSEFESGGGQKFFEKKALRYREIK